MPPDLAEADVSIIIPTYNRGALVIDAVESALNASDGVSCQIVVVDDGSQDDTTERLKRFKSRIDYHRTANKGVSAARNLGVAFSRAPLIRFLDSDDQLIAGSTRALRDLLLSVQADVAVGQCAEVNENGQLIQSEYGLTHYFSESNTKEQMFGRAVPLNSALFQKSSIIEVGGFDEHCRFGEDFDLILRGLISGWSVATTPINSCVICHSAEDRLTRETPAMLYAYLETMVANRILELELTGNMLFTPTSRINLGKFLWRAGRSAARLGYRAESVALFSLAKRTAGRESETGSVIVRALYRLINPYRSETIVTALKRW